MKQFAVIGLGRFGRSVARTLESLGHQVMGVDVDGEIVASLRLDITHAVQADCTDEESLATLGLRNFDGVVVAIGGDVEASVLVTLLLKEQGVPRVLAKAGSEIHGRLLTKVGADTVIYPERDMGTRLAHHLVTSSAVDSIELSRDFRVVEVPAPAAAAGQTLGQLNLRSRFGLHVLAIRRGDAVLVAPGAQDSVAAGDMLVVLGDVTGLVRLEGIAKGPGQAGTK